MFIETSAKTGQNINKLFTLLAEKIMKKLQDGRIDPNMVIVPGLRTTESRKEDSQGRLKVRKKLPSIRIRRGESAADCFLP